MAVKSEMPPSFYADSFSEQTLYHATLYIPVGAWDAYVYDDNWYKFINIREVASEQHEIVADMAYTLMNAKDFSYAVYDPVNDRVRMVASVNVDESDLNHCWQTVEVSGKKFLYNIGAKRFAVPSTDGSSFTLSETVGSVEMTDGTDGIVLNGHTETQWALVLDEKMSADLSLNENIMTAITSLEDVKLTNGTIYDFSGRKMNVRSATTEDAYLSKNVNVNNLKLKKGIYIVNGKKMLVK